MTKIASMSEEQIVAAIEELKASGDELITQLCVYLAEMKRRKLTHRMMSHRVFRHFELIAKGKILPGVVAMFNGEKWYVERFSKLPEQLQLAILNGRELPGAEVNMAGEIVEREKAVIKMGRATIDRVFPSRGGVATFTEQRNALQETLDEKSAETAKPFVHADKASGTIRVGRSEATIAELKAALADLGLTITARRRAEPRNPSQLEMRTH